MKTAALDKVANVVGKHRTTIRKAEAIIDAAEAEPERFANLLADMDRTGRVDGPYRRLKTMQQAEAIRAEPSPLPCEYQTHGPKVVLKNGYDSVSAAIRAGMEIEKNGGTIKDAVSKSGLSLKAYRLGRDVILLSERDDLPAKAAAIVKDALSEMNETHRVAHAASQVKSLIQKVWGSRGGNRFKSEKKRLDKFLTSICVVQTVCVSASEVVIPHIGGEQKEIVLADLTEAAAALRLLMRRIKQEEDDMSAPPGNEIRRDQFVMEAAE